MPLLNAAILYQRAGLAVLPARLTEKRPALAGWKDYQSRLPTEAEVSAWFANRHDALCLVTGAVSGNLELIDFDNGGELFNPWAQLVEAEAPGLMGRLVVESSQSGGWHVLYRCAEKVSGNIHLAQRAVPTPDDTPVVIGGKTYKPRRNNAGGWEITLTLIETRGEGGLFLCHPTPGYELIQGEIDQLPTVTAEQRDILLAAAWSLNELIPPPVAVPPESNPHVQGERPGDAFNERGDVPALLRQHGWTLLRDGENQYWRRPGKSSGSWSATLKGRVFYVFSSNAAPFDGPKAYGPFAVYTILEHGGDFIAAARALRTQGFGDDKPALQTGKVDLSRIVKDPPANEPDEPLFITARQLIHDYPEMRQPLIHGLLRSGETMNLISAPKIGKSWLVLDLALSVVTGRHWLGQFQTQRGKVLLIDNELHPETLANRIPKVAAARGIAPDQYADHLCIRTLRGRLEDLVSLERFISRLQAGQFALIILDAFYRFLPRGTDENDNGAMANLYNLLDRYAETSGASLVVIHHSTKGNQSLKAITDVGAGAGSQGRAADAHIAIRKHEEEDVVVFEGENRSWPRPAPLCLRWQWPVFMPAPDLDPAELRTEKPRKRADEWTAEVFVQTVVPQGVCSRQAILAAAVTLGLSEYKAERLLRQAVGQGLLHRHDDPNPSRPASYSRDPLPEVLL